MYTRPPLTRYQREGGLPIEFVADLKGSATDRKGNPKEVVAVAGITAEQLRYVYPLELRPWSPAEGVGPPVLSAVRIANPVTYLFQKILVNARRQPPKDGNDLLYIADTVDMFGDALTVLRDEWVAVRPHLDASHVQTFQKAARALTKHADVHRRASLVAQSIGRPRPRTLFAETVRTLLETIYVDR